jgi:hypothetical protein
MQSTHQLSLSSMSHLLQLPVHVNWLTSRAETISRWIHALPSSRAAAAATALSKPSLSVLSLEASTIADRTSSRRATTCRTEHRHKPSMLISYDSKGLGTAASYADDEAIHEASCPGSKCYCMSMATLSQSEPLRRQAESRSLRWCFTHP